MSSIPFFMDSHSRPTAHRWPDFFQAWMPVLLLACVFIAESTRFLGSDHTSAPLHRLCGTILGSSIDHNWSQIHHMIRKTGHFLGYGILSLAIFRGLRLTLPRKAQLGLQAFAVMTTCLIASADEIHQAFLPNRTGKFTDVLLDTAGALVLQCALMLATRIANHLHSQPTEQQASLQAQLSLAI